ncbi:MAG: SRPBCC family protein [Chloroflexi bacterium]|nr:SRPBCC family protein [Chloroflexota bacterium]
MGRVTVTTDIKAPPEAVWKALSDASRYAEWVVFTDDVISVSEGEFGKGTVYHEQGGVEPFKGRSEWTVTEFDPPHHQVHIGRQGPLTIHLDFRLEPSEQGTRYTQVTESRFPLPLRPIAAVMDLLFMRRRMKSGLQETAANFKAAVEAGQQST